MQQIYSIYVALKMKDHLQTIIMILGLIIGIIITSCDIYYTKIIKGYYTDPLNIPQKQQIEVSNRLIKTAKVSPQVPNSLINEENIQTQP